MKEISDSVLIEKLLSDEDIDEVAAKEIKEMIEKEMSKPPRRRDYDRITKLSQAYAEITGTAEKIKESSKEQINNILLMAEKVTSKRTRRYFGKYRMTVSLMAAVLVLISADRISAAAFNKSIISTILTMKKGSVIVNFNETDINETPNDPYGMLAECAKYDIYPEVPYYIPEGFTIKFITNHITEGFLSRVSFVFENGNQTIRFDFRRYFKNMGNICIPSDKNNISETIVNGHNAVVSKEDNQYVITYINEKTTFYMFTQDVPYDECEKIVASIK